MLTNNDLTMKTIYRIIVNMRVSAGYVETAQFFIANAKNDAVDMFKLLQGQQPASGATPLLRLDLVAEDSDGIDIVLHSLDCTLKELTENTKIIMRETFRLLNLEQ
jgi:hypothetical protein